MRVKKIFFKRNPALISKVIEKEFHILNPLEGKLFTLNQTAASIWSFLWKPRSMNELITKFIQKFKIPSINAEKDINDFINKSLKNKLLIKEEK